ncbi:hypothetical protein CK203_092523 [Vitis vinifera]|uniref:EF-hand domain-containing protein n=1 Tax=Vitis vinifera TaxID=29760 RepID=A0A438DHP3_VITVI|nr:hypothetical protein CK203_092523 [Vitis vinifera]
MEEIREAALAYYEAGTQEQKQLAWAFFQTLDVDGDGTVSVRSSSTSSGAGATGCSIMPTFIGHLTVTAMGVWISTNHTTFDLCSACYRGKRFSHQHAAILDNYTLLTAQEDDDHGRIRTTKYESANFSREFQLEGREV